MIWPIIEVYWIVAKSLGQLLYRDKIYQTNQLAELILKEAARLFYSSETTFFVQNSSAIIHTFDWFIKSGLDTPVLSKRILTVPRGFGKTEELRMVQLTPQFRKSRKLLATLARRIGSFRAPAA